MKNRIKNKAQEEMVGFALIIVIVFIILLVFLSFSLARPQKEAVDGYEAEGFIQSFLIYTTECEDYRDVYVTIQDLIYKCYENKTCLDDKNSCSILVTTLKNISKESWNVETNSSIKGYSLEIKGETQGIVSIKVGNETRSSKGSIQTLPRPGRSVEIAFKAYY